MRIARRHIVMCGAVAESGFLPCAANVQVRSCIPEFESRWLLHRADVAQVEERLFETQEVAGSKPAIGTRGCHVPRPATVPCTYGAESSILSRSTIAAFSGVRHEEPARSVRDRSMLIGQSVVTRLTAVRVRVAQPLFCDRGGIW